MRQRAAGAGRGYALWVFLVAVAIAANAGLVGSTQPAEAGTRAPGVECEHVTGTTGGVVTLGSCHSAGTTAGIGRSQERFSFPVRRRLE